MRSRRGSSAVFLCIILAALVTVSISMIAICRTQTLSSRADGICRLSGDSLLSEFHREILEEYGLFLLTGNDDELSEKYRKYLRYAFSEDGDVKVSQAAVSAGRYSAVDPETIRVRLIEYMKSGGADLLADEPDRISPPGSSPAGFHHLRHGPTIASLPSRQLPEKDLLTQLGSLDRMKDLRGVFSEGTERYLLSSYVLGKFNTCIDPEHTDHFFRCEAEYILHGKLSDEENHRRNIRALRALRTPSNLAFLYSDPVRRDALAAASEAIAPGPVGLALQAAIAGAWAYAESVNDVSLLLSGHRVPAVKDNESWALDLDTVFDHLVRGALDPDKYEEQEETPDPESLVSAGSLPTLHPAQDKGLNYGQYLRVLLFMKDDGMTAARILDLIQINTRKNIDGSFLICEQSTGIETEARINERTFSYEKEY